MVWVSGPGSFDLQSGCNLPLGTKTCHWQFRLPVDVPTGTSSVNKIAFWTGSRQINLPFKKVEFQVVGNSGLTFPTSAEVTVKASQVQLLRGEIIRLQTRVQMLKASVVGQQEPLSLTTRRVLREKLEQELHSVKVTESKFQELGDKSQVDASQVFFDDLRIGYSEVLAQLSAEAKGTSVKADITAVAWFPQTQVNQRKPLRYPLTALAALRPFELNELAYKLVADSESLTVNLEVNSNPEGATILYGRRGDTSYKRHQSLTNSTIKSLPYAIWTVRFQKQGFGDKDIEFNPFVEPNRVITANLEK